VLRGSEARLRRAGANQHLVDLLGLCRKAVSLALYQDATDRPVIPTSTALIAYLQFELGAETVERFRTIYLNGRNELLADDVIVSGTVDAAPFYPREIIGRAIELGATSLIVAHNHPSGDPKPSHEDVACTRALAVLCAGLGIKLLDHIVVGRSSVTSFRKCGLLKP
jgi:DNA repair protein RadC